VSYIRLLSDLAFKCASLYTD